MRLAHLAGALEQWELFDGVTQAPGESDLKRWIPSFVPSDRQTKITTTVTPVDSSARSSPLGQLISNVETGKSLPFTQRSLDAELRAWLGVNTAIYAVRENTDTTVPIWPQRRSHRARSVSSESLAVAHHRRKLRELRTLDSKWEDYLSELLFLGAD